MRSLLLCLLLTCAGVFRSAADKVDAKIAEEMKAHPIPGLVLEVIRHGKCIKREGYGFANLEWRARAQPEDVFEIGSITKQFTAAGILLLAQEGKLSVDDLLSQHLTNTPDIWKGIKLRHLLTHTSGLPNYTLIDGFELRQHLTQAQFIQLLGAHPLNFQPGEKWSYCNSGFNLLGYIIENVSGTNYWTFMEDRIFGPLGMHSTTNRDPRDILPHRASGYETDKAGRYINRDYDLTDIFAAGAIVSTVDDMAKWSASLTAHTLLTADSEKEMWTPVHLNNGSIHQYGFGWFLSPLDGHVNIGHSGSTSGFSASFQRFPEDDLEVIVLTNANEDGVATKVAKDVARLYFSK
jgi:CubicO group peptidase (beta-lactamase class C family)